MKTVSQYLLGSFIALNLMNANAAAVAIDTSNRAFTAESATSIVKATETDCKIIDQSGIGRAVWVQVILNGNQYNECIRYYQYGLAGGKTSNNRAIVYFSGDVQGMSGTVSTDYTKQKPQDKQNEAVYWSSKLNNKPYIAIARPGLYGSSGVANGARKPLESLLMTGALNQIKERHRIVNYVLVGHSSGGHVVSSLLSKRSDIICAVPSSAPSSPKLRAQFRGSATPTKELEAADSVTKYNVRHAALRVFVVGDKNDRNVPWPAQQVMDNKLKQLGWPTTIINFNAKDSTRHVVADQARMVAGMCADGRTTAYIQNAAQGSEFK
jgi:hypothetical protein